MNILKIIVVIIVTWFIIKIRHFILNIKINKNSSENLNSKSNKDNLDIWDAEYEEIE